MIKFSSVTPKICCNCGDNIYTFEKRNNRNSGASEHLRCDVMSLHRQSIKWIKSIARNINYNN